MTILPQQQKATSLRNFLPSSAAEPSVSLPGPGALPAAHKSTFHGSKMRGIFLQGREEGLRWRHEIKVETSKEIQVFVGRETGGLIPLQLGKKISLQIPTIPN